MIDFQKKQEPLSQGRPPAPRVMIDPPKKTGALVMIDLPPKRSSCRKVGFQPRGSRFILKKRGPWPRGHEGGDLEHVSLCFL